MALIPLKQEVTITRSRGPLDGYGNPTETEEVTLKCRVDEGTFLVEYKSSGNLSATAEEVAKARVIFDKLVDIQYSDLISYTNEIGQEIKRSPKKVDIKRHLNGKPLLTEVYI